MTGVEILTRFDIMHLEDIENLWNVWELNGNPMRCVWKNNHFYKTFRHIVESQNQRSPSRVRNALNIPPRQTSVLRSELRGWLRQNLMFPSEESSELSNYSNDDTIRNHDSEDANYEHDILVATALTPVWDFIEYLEIYVLKRKSLKFTMTKWLTILDSHNFFVPYGHTGFGLRGLTRLELKCT